jgi:hypothetical protein
MEHVVAAEALGQLARLGVPHPDPVAGRQRVRGRALHGRLDLARALGTGQAQAGRQRGTGQPVRMPDPEAT